MNDYPILQFFTFDHLPEHLADVSRPFADLAEVIAAETDGDPETEVALRKLLEAKDAAVRAVVGRERRTDPPPSAHLQSGLGALLWLSEQSFHPDDAAAIAPRRPGCRCAGCGVRRLAHDLLSLRDADPAAYRALMARLDADQGGNR